MTSANLKLLIRSGRVCVIPVADQLRLVELLNSIRRDNEQLDTNNRDLEIENEKLKARDLTGLVLAESSDLISQCTLLQERVEILEQTARQCQACRKAALLKKRDQTKRGDVSVFLRIKPLPAGSPFPAPFQIIDDSIINVARTRHQSLHSAQESKAYHFDYIFPESADNAIIHDRLREIVLGTLDGINACILVSGQSGSGKSHTMSSSDGIVARSMEQLLQSIPDDGSSTVTLRCRVIQVYGKTLDEMFQSSNETVVTNLNDAKAILATVQKARYISATYLNATSSRSHLVFIVELHRKSGVADDEQTTYLSFVDLAGSEGVEVVRSENSTRSSEQRNEEERQRIREGGDIRNDNLQLGNCIRSLRKKLGYEQSGEHMWRNSKLTEALKPYMTGANVAMIITIRSEKQYIIQTEQSLRFARDVSRANTSNPPYSRLRGTSPNPPRTSPVL